jgi:pimeloyl-ACP methyl ester carboxylesterase
MIVVSGGGEDSIEQLAYQLGQGVVCDGLSLEQGQLVEEHFPPTAKGPTYEDYTTAMEVLVEIEGWETFAGPAFKTEEEWQPWPTDIDAYFDPMTVIQTTTIPVLAVFGELDRWIDPVQGAAAYEQALTSAGNPDFHVELIPGVGHTMLEQSSMCSGGGTTSERYLELLTKWAGKLGQN